MSVAAIIEEPEELAGIIEWAAHREQETPSSVWQISIVSGKNPIS
jgi:hypothetical protein